VPHGTTIELDRELLDEAREVPGASGIRIAEVTCRPTEWVVPRGTS
jgi:hypothetical protein